MAQDVERRKSVRHETVHDRAGVQLADWAGIRIEGARLLNFSATGALILTDRVPALHQALRVRLDLAREIGWFSAKLVRVGRPNEVGIKFVHPFPQDFLPNCHPDHDSTLVEEIDD